MRIEILNVVKWNVTPRRLLVGWLASRMNLTAYFALIMAKAVLTVTLVSTRLLGVTPAKIVMLVS